jgi:uncharacterized membrane-anchored protein YitT (DUF2179 family)
MRADPKQSFICLLWTVYAREIYTIINLHVDILATCMFSCGFSMFFNENQCLPLDFIGFSMEFSQLFSANICFLLVFFSLSMGINVFLLFLNGLE